jgi:hypothetical protein
MTWKEFKEYVDEQIGTQNENINVDFIDIGTAFVSDLIIAIDNFGLSIRDV